MALKRILSLAALLILPFFTLSAQGVRNSSDSNAVREAYKLKGFRNPVYYDAVKPMEKGDNGELVAVMIHGWGGGMRFLPEQESLEESLKGVYVIAPRFPRVPVMKKKGVVDDRPHWNDNYDANIVSPSQALDDWRGGGDADGFRFSSFDVVDRIFSILGNRRLYPNLKRVILVGYSAGGQFVSRYVAVGKGVVRDGVEIRYVSMAASTYLNLNDDVPWLYGLADRPRYCAGMTKQQMLANLASRKAFYACGELDSVNGSTDRRAPAMLQGAGRIERLYHLQEHIHLYPDWERMSTFHVIPGIAHNAVKAYKDPVFLNFVFENQ